MPRSSDTHQSIEKLPAASYRSATCTWRIARDIEQDVSDRRHGHGVSRAGEHAGAWTRCVDHPTITDAILVYSESSCCIEAISGEKELALASSMETRALSRAFSGGSATKE